MEGKRGMRKDGVDRSRRLRKRRAVVAARVAVCLTTLCGFAALTFDAGADNAPMEQSAGIGSGEWCYAQGGIDAYGARLEAIIQALGGRRPVALFE